MTARLDATGALIDAEPIAIANGSSDEADPHVAPARKRGVRR